MKKVLLSLLLSASVSTLFAQVLPQLPGRPCPIDIKSNQGGGNCGPCTTRNDGDPTPLTNPTAKVTLTFNQPLCDNNNPPRLISVRDQNGEDRPVRCGTGEVVSTNNGLTKVEYCLYSNEQSGGTGNDGNFYNQPNLIVTLRYTCSTGPSPITVNCNEQGQNIPLPVGLKSFTASRNRQNISLRWTTAVESDNRGFNIQRNTRGTWETVAFVPSLATGGNSSSDLTYSFSDLNDFKGISQYRLQQVDIDGKARLSEIRSVRGEGATGKTVIYPNPSSTGAVSVVFDDAAGGRDVILSDISGRTVKSWKGIKENNLRITNLMPGTYMLRIVNELDGTAVHEKIVVNK